MQQPASSVSHFDTSLTPNELMEPFATANPTRLLATQLLKDVGWTLIGPTPTLTPTPTNTPDLTCPQVDLGSTLPVSISGSTTGGMSLISSATCAGGNSAPDATFLYTAL